MAYTANNNTPSVSVVGYSVANSGRLKVNLKLSPRLRLMRSNLTDEEIERLTQLTGDLVVAIERVHSFLFDPVAFEADEIARASCVKSNKCRIPQTGGRVGKGCKEEASGEQQA